MKRTAQRGFTLVEMMVVVVIIAILASLMIGVSSRPVGANARNISEQLVSTVNFAKLRASATRRIHLVQINPHQVSVHQHSLTGLLLPSTPTWEMIQNVSIANSVTFFDAQAGVLPNGGGSPGGNSSLNYSIYIRPDLQSTASTVFVSDGKDEWRVFIYHVTGGAFARQGW